MRLLKPVPPTQQKQSDGMIESADSNLQTFLFTGYRKKNFRFFFSVLEAKISVKEL